MFKTFLILLWIASHPVHVTLLSADYSEESKGFNLFLKVYYDDFLIDFSAMNSDMALPDVVKSPDSSKPGIEWYLSKKIGISAGKEILPLEVLDYSLDGNELRINLFSRMKRSPDSVTLSNSILDDIYKDQTNLIILRIGNFEEGVKLTPEKREHVFKVK